MKQITEKEIARQIAELINKNVNDLKQDDEKWKNQYDSVLQELESEIKLTEELLEDFTESKLSINLIEQEGYLRCLRTMVNRFRDWELLL
jgi:CRISPR/Cas system CMR-associated protein Cmr5 small subunit